MVIDTFFSLNYVLAFNKRLNKTMILSSDHDNSYSMDARRVDMNDDEIKLNPHTSLRQE